MLILNDVHLGVNRQGGTTPSSREALRDYLFRSFEESFYDTREEHVCILGDLFDQFEVEGRDWLKCYLILQDWLVRGGDRRLTLVAGNHDHSPKALRVSSYEMLCMVLREQFGDRLQVIGIDTLASVAPNVWSLAHCSNQGIFDAKLIEMLTYINSGDRVLLHANYDNNFAAQSDHSLNVTREQAEAFERKGATLYFAHEHQARTALGGSVVVFGNQWPTSISDCLNNDMKYAHILSGGVTKVPTWGRNDPVGYFEMEWRELVNVKDLAWSGFFKVTGTASANEAGDCINAISKFRAKSSAFVITNSVCIDGISENSSLPENFEATKAFDVLAFINDNLNESQREVVSRLMAHHQ